MSVKQFQGCLLNNFTDEWNAQIVSKAATKLRKHIQKWKIKCLFKALSLTIVLKMQCHLFMNSLLELVLRCFENLLSIGTAALVELLVRKISQLDINYLGSLVSALVMTFSLRFLKLGVNAVVCREQMTKFILIFRTQIGLG